MTHHQLPGGTRARRRAIFQDHGYQSPRATRDWLATAQLARDVSALLHLVADGNHAAAISMINAQLESGWVTPHIEEHRGDWILHFHAPDADFAQGWAAGIAAALAIAYSSEEVDRVGRCVAADCTNLLLDRGWNKQRRFFSLRCQNRAKSAAYRDRHYPTARSQRERVQPASTTPVRAASRRR